MGLIADLKRDVLNDKTSLATALRRTKAIAALVGEVTLLKWAENELSGYSSKEEVPEYRIISCQSYGEFLGSTWRDPRAQIPDHVIPEKWRDWANEARFLEGVRGLEALQESSVTDGSSRSLHEEWPPELTAFLHNRIYERAQCRRAWKEIPAYKLDQTLDHIRNRLLDFVLALERDFPDVATRDENLSSVPNNWARNVVNNIFAGSHSVIATGPASTQTVDQSVVVEAGNLASLRNYLSSVGIEPADIADLEAVLENEPSPPTNGSYGKAVADWIGRMTKKAAEGTWKVGLKTAPAIVTETLKRYWGTS